MDKRRSGAILVFCVLCVTGFLFLTHHKNTAEQGSDVLSAEKQTDMTNKVDHDVTAEAVDSETPKIAKPNIVKEKTTPVEEDHKWHDAAKAAINVSDPNVKYRAIWSLGKHPVAESIEILSVFLGDENIEIVSEAIDQIGSIGMQNGELKEKVYRLLEMKAMDSSFPAQGQALVTAAMLGNNDLILPVISKFISGEDYGGGLDFHAARALTFAAVPEAVPLLQQLLYKTENLQVKRNVLSNLTTINAPEARELLENMLHSTDGENQVLSTRALSMKNSHEFNQVLTNAIVDETLGVQAMSGIAKSPAAGEVFGEVLMKKAVPTIKKIGYLQLLAKKSSSASSDVRSGVIVAVEPFLDSDDSDLEIASIRTLGAMGTKEIAELIQPKFTSTNPAVRQEALKAFPVHPDTYKSMLEMVWDSNENISRSALTICEIFVNESDRRLLENVATAHNDEYIRENARKIIDNYLMKPES